MRKQHRRKAAKPESAVVRATAQAPSPLQLFLACHAAAFAVIGLMVAVTFGRALWHSVLNWDDNVNVITNPLVHDPSWIRLVRIWTSPYESLYVPLVYTTYVLDLVVSGGRISALHASNLFWHAMSGCGVYLILYRLCANRMACVLGAALFVVHPLQVEPVAWITGRKDVLSGCFSIFAVWEFDRWLQSRARSSYALSTVLYIAALLAKPSAITVALLVTCLTVYRGALNRGAIRWLAPWFLVAFVFGGVNMAVQSGLGDAPFVVSLWKRPFVAADCVFFYLGKVLAPVGLYPIYARSTQSIFLSPLIWLKLPLLLILAGLSARMGREAALAGAWFILPLLPILGLMPFLYQSFSTVADRYCYVSMVAVAMAAMFVLRSTDTWKVWGRTASRTFFAGLVVVCMGLSIRQTGFWFDSESLWRRELQIDPQNTTAHHNLGEILLEKGRRAEARMEFETTLKLDPNSPTVYVNLSSLSLEEGQTTEALRYAELGVKYAPKLIDARVALGEAYVALREYREAADAFRAASDLSPLSGFILNRLGYTLVKGGDYRGAEEVLRKAIDQNARFALARINLSMALIHQNKMSQAVEHLRIARQLEPDNEWVRKTLHELEGQR